MKRKDCGVHLIELGLVLPLGLCCANISIVFFSSYVCVCVGVCMSVFAQILPQFSIYARIASFLHRPQIVYGVNQYVFLCLVSH